MWWKLVATFCLATLGGGWCSTDLATQCLERYGEDLDNDFLEGTWYRIVHFTLIGVTVPTTECPEFTYTKPNSTELERYKDEYLKPDIPYSFDDTPLAEDGGRFRPYGLLIGNKETKFFIMDPDTHFFRTLFDIRVYQRINDNYMIYQDCTLRGNIKWLMSRNRNPPQAEVDALIDSRPDINDMRRQRYCVIM